MNDAMLAKAIQETEEAKEKEFAKWRKDNDTRRQRNQWTEEGYQKELMATKGLLRAKEQELVEHRVAANEIFLQVESESRDYLSKLIAKGKELDAAEDKHTRLQNTVREHLAKKRELEESLDNLKGMLD
jgi:hypothetical protein